MRVAGELARCAGHDSGVRDLGVPDRYRVTDADGSRPDAWGYIAAYGTDETSGRDVERFR